MKVLLIGSGGREHALAWKLSQSPRLEKLYAAPGSDAIKQLAEIAGLNPSDHSAMATFCRKRGIGLVVVGPEDPLAGGLADALSKAHISVFGPKKDAARLEASKSFAKDFMRRHGIPTAKSETREDAGSALKAAEALGFPVVIKADGLAAGNGVVICENRAAAAEVLKDFIEKDLHGEAGRTVIVEEMLRGRETSFMGLCDGETFLSLPPSSDHKRLLDGDRGPNTGGMGVFAPTPEIDGALSDRIRTEIVDKVLAGLRKDGLKYCGILYIGLMLTEQGPKVLEFNVRFGDPETQAVLPLVKNDLLELMVAATRGKLRDHKLEWKGASVCVVLASQGYPSKPIIGQII
ncbi:MAG: phosphoribosylamine--glycine ligase, partial [Elusimicrobiota bacterium]